MKKSGRNFFGFFFTVIAVIFCCLERKTLVHEIAKKKKGNVIKSRLLFNYSGKPVARFGRSNFIFGLLDARCSIAGKYEYLAFYGRNIFIMHDDDVCDENVCNRIPKSSP